MSQCHIDVIKNQGKFASQLSWEEELELEKSSKLNNEGNLGAFFQQSYFPASLFFLIQFTTELTLANTVPIPGGLKLNDVIPTRTFFPLTDAAPGPKMKN